MDEIVDKKEFSKWFKGRDDKLKKIIRFNMDEFTPMFYRTNLFLHSQRVYLLVKDILPTILPIYNNKINSKKALTLALIHDDAEIETGDVLLYHKDRMTSQELAKVDKQEIEAIKKLAKTWPKKINGFFYKNLLYHALKKDCLEAQIVSYADKLDAFCESLHELHAKNELFTKPSINYSRRMRKLPNKFHLLKKISQFDHPLIHPNWEINIKQIMNDAKYHTSASIQMNTGIPYYEKWKELTIKYIGIGPLINIKEKN